MKPTSRIRRPSPNPVRSLSKLLHKGRMGRIRQAGNVPLFSEPEAKEKAESLTKDERE